MPQKADTCAACQPSETHTEDKHTLHAKIASTPLSAKERGATHRTTNTGSFAASRHSTGCVRRRRLEMRTVTNRAAANRSRLTDGTAGTRPDATKRHPRDLCQAERAWASLIGSNCLARLRPCVSAPAPSRVRSGTGRHSVGDSPHEDSVYSPNNQADAPRPRHTLADDIQIGLATLQARSVRRAVPWDIWLRFRHECCANTHTHTNTQTHTRIHTQQLQLDMEKQAFGRP